LENGKVKVGVTAVSFQRKNVVNGKKARNIFNYRIENYTSAKIFKIFKLSLECEYNKTFSKEYFYSYGTALAIRLNSVASIKYKFNYKYVKIKEYVYNTYINSLFLSLGF